MRMPAAQRSKKVATNVSIRADLVKRAKQLGLNLSGLAESAIEHAIREAENAKWLEENEEAIRYTNDHVAKHGLFSDSWRKF